MDAERARAVVACLDPAVVRARNAELLEQPPLFDIEVASSCNVVCTFCPRDVMVRDAKLMSRETFAALTGFLPDGAVAMLGGLGDALVHPDVAEMVDALVRRGVSTCVITNGVRLTTERQEALLAAGVDEIQVSVHGFDPAIVQQIMPRGARPDVVRRQVEELAARGGPRLRINFVETPVNASEREAVGAWARDLGARFFPRLQHTRGGTVGEQRPSEGCTGCGVFGSVTFISADGDVLPCVNDVRGDGKLGNVRDVSWADVLAWKRRTIAQHAWFDACRACDDDYRWVLLANAGLRGA